MKPGSVGIASAPVKPMANVSSATVQRDVEDRRDLRSDARLHALVVSAQQGDASAFGEIYEHFFAPISRLASFYLGSAAEDATAETFLRAWSSLTRYRPERATLAAWLYGIARHVVADELKRRKRTEPVDQVPERGRDGCRDDAIVLAAAIKKLPRDQRRIIEMKYFLGLKNDEVAVALNKSVGAINTQQWRALRSLEKSVGR